MDADATGTISLEEFRSALSKHPEISSAEVERLFHVMDVTNKGSVDYNEFLAATLATQRRLDEPSLRAAFAMLDVDGDGVITKADLMRTMGSAGSAESAVDEMFAQLHCTSGRLYFGDFLRLMAQGRQGSRALRSQGGGAAASCRESPRGHGRCFNCSASGAGPGSARDLLSFARAHDSSATAQRSAAGAPSVQRAYSTGLGDVSHAVAAYDVAELALESSYKGAVDTLRRTIEERSASRRSVAAGAAYGAGAADGAGTQGREAGSAKLEGGAGADSATSSMKSEDGSMRIQPCSSIRTMMATSTSALSAQI